MKYPRFGVSGNPLNFNRSQEKGDTLRAPAWLEDMGLDAYEYAAVRGVNMKEARARALGEAAENHGIRLSVHAPYFTNFTSQDPEKITSSIRHLSESVQIASWMGARSVVLHPGWYKGHDSPQSALVRCMETLPRALEALESFDEKVFVAPETSGSVAQFGGLDEILSICTLHPRLVPCLDFAHMHARLIGHEFDDAAFDEVFRLIEKNLGREKLEKSHIHYYPVEYGPKGEKCHHAFDEPEFGPRPEPFIAALRRWNLNPTVICESRDRQDLDALLMKEMYLGQL